MGTTARSWGRALVVAGTLVLGCGAGGGGGAVPPSCLTLHPCGGDLVGTWHFVGACVTDTATLTASARSACAGATVNSVEFGVSGSITFNADLTYSARGWNTAFREVTTSPVTCGSGTSCADQSMSVTSSDGSFSRDTCSGSDVCNCTASGLQAITETGTYTTSGSSLELIGPTTSRGRSYCVEGALLHIVEVGITSTDPTVPVIVLDDSVAMRL